MTVFEDHSPGMGNATLDKPIPAPPADRLDVPGISRSDQLKALGNGVVPAQAAAATRRWLNDYANA